jgi:alpha-1,3-rhamnosyltransferase
VRVSVVIPSFNHAPYVESAVASVLDQTLPDLELLVIDDGSTDGSADGIARFLDRRGDARARLRARENRGLCATLNEGLRWARGEFFAYLGSDDVWEPAKLERQVEASRAAGPNAGACYTDCLVIDAEGRILDRLGRQYRFRGGDIYRDLARMRFHPPSPTNLFVRERLIRAGGFDESLPIEDRDAWLRVARHYRVAYVDEPLARFRVHGSNTSTRRPDHMRASNQATFAWMLRTDPALAPWRRAILAHDQAGYAASFYNAGAYTRARREAFAALRTFPFDRLAWRMVVRSLILQSPPGAWLRRLRGRRPA